MATLGYSSSFGSRNVYSIIQTEEDYEITPTHFKSINVGDKFFIINYKQIVIGRKHFRMPASIDYLPVTKIVIKFPGKGNGKLTDSDYGCFLYFKSNNTSITDVVEEEFSVRIEDVDSDGKLETNVGEELLRIFTDKADADKHFNLQQRRFENQVCDLINEDYKRYQKVEYELSFIKDSLIHTKNDWIKYVKEFGTDELKESVMNDNASLKFYMARLDKEY